RGARTTHAVPVRAFAVVAVVCIAAAGCSSSSKSARSASSVPTSSTNAPAAPSGRVVVRGNATLDGVPLDAQFLGAVVRRDRLITPCQADIPSVAGGRYEIGVLADSEGTGCGAAGAEVLLWTFVNGKKLYSTSALAWPAAAGTSVSFDPKFASAAPNGDATAVSEL